MAILVGAEGSLFPNLSQSQANTGAKRITKIEFNDWNQLAGTVNHPRSLCVCSSAKNVKDAPACSKADQKKITKKATMNMTTILCFSNLLSVLSEKST